MLSIMFRRFFVTSLLCFSSAAFAADHKTKNVIFVMTDGLRWQEVFSGADAALMNKENGAVKDVEALKKAYWRETPKERRETLMPFFWSTIAAQGQVYGNRALESDAYVTNNRNFSYPGYSETLCGFPDPAIDSNNKIPNRNVTVLEWLNQKSAYRGKIAAFSAWDVFPFIINGARANILVNSGFDQLPNPRKNQRIELLNQLKQESTKPWDVEPYDSITFHSAFEYLKEEKPRVLFLSFGETDEWSHAGDYAKYLDAAHRVDQYLKTIWDWAQSQGQYRGQTSLIFAVDHGRGEAPVLWKSHGEKVPDSKYIWMAYLGPDTRPLGERSKVPPVTQSQIAATLAGLLGEDYPAAVSKAGKPVTDALPAK